MKESILNGRTFLKANWESFEGIMTDQMRGKPAPETQKPLPENAKLISLPAIDEVQVKDIPLSQALRQRRSKRRFKSTPMTFEELSFLLWATQGVKKAGETYTLRTVPSAGARHSFETYLYIKNITAAGEGLYRYLPFDHKLCLISQDDTLYGKLIEALFKQDYNAAVTFIWTTVPYRMEWRYDFVSHKVIAMDAGHVCQNLYLACEAVECGTCAIGAYDQKALDQLLAVDGIDEFAIYVAPVGKLV